MKIFHLDVSDSNAVEDTVKRIENDIAPIDILVNVAGVLRMGAIHSLSDEDWNKTFSVNSTGVFYMSRAVSKHMMQRKSGQLLQLVQMQQIRREWRWLHMLHQKLQRRCL